MFKVESHPSAMRSAFRTLALIFHTAVRDVRRTHRSALMSLAINLFQTIIFVMAFYAIFSILGIRGSKLRGDFMMYVLSGIFLFMTFIKTMSAVFGSEGPTSAMMQHRTMNTMVSIAGAALSSLYMQVLSLTIVLLGYHLLTHNVAIAQPKGAVKVLLLTWLTGASIGMVFLALKPWAPNLTKMVQTVFTRVNMFASGKMFVANTLPLVMLPLFSWNPLFHLIDQMRGYVFINYTPRNTELLYPFWIMLACLMIGLMAEFYTRKRISLSWTATQ